MKHKPQITPPAANSGSNSYSDTVIFEQENNSSDLNVTPPCKYKQKSAPQTPIKAQPQRK